MHSPEAEEEEGLGSAVADFLRQWRRELASRKEEGRGDQQGEKEEEDAGPVKRRKGEEVNREPSPLLVLPAGRGAAGMGAGLPEDQQRTVVGSVGGAPSSHLVDRLIADLDEVNTVPFFDVQLPREVALIIFGFLSLRDLGVCAQVSQSWHCLVEDNVLWCKLCHSMGYETDTDIHDRVNWKTVVMEIVLRKKKVEKNWKERICGLSDHQPDNVGVLCCVDYCSQQILACYSSGEVWYWDVQDSRGPVRMSELLSPFPPSVPSCCALTDGWAVVGSHRGNLKLFDTDTYTQVYGLTEQGTVHSVSIASREGITAVGVALCHTYFPPSSFAEETRSRVMTLVARGGVWEQTYLSLPHSEKVNRLALVPRPAETDCPYSVLYSTWTTLTLHPLTPHSSPSHLLTSAGSRGATCINCFDYTSDTVACATSAYGYRVQVIDLATGAHTASLGGHGQQITCINVSLSPPHHLVSGSADKRVRVFDVRCGQYPVLTLRGHGGHVTSVQMDEWKVVSGSMDGTMIVWDQRMAGELWRSHDRHPVESCWFEGSHLVEAHVPMDKSPVIDGTNPNICHRRQRGLIRVFDFSVDPLYYTKMLPSICSSAYDEPSASFYNLDLRLPYDAIT